jgi:hypothetical protein
MSADCNRAPCGAGGEAFRIPESLCPLGSSLIDGGHKLKKKIQLSSQLHEQYTVEGDYFHYSNVRADGSWFHRFNRERKP